MDSEDLNNMSAKEIIELQKKNCIFCKIISKEIPSHEIYSDEKAVVILDINPANEGHCLILPKEHFQIMPQLPEEVVAHLFRVAKLTSRSLLKSLNVKGTSTFVANGALAGQKSPHFMIHVIPRKPGDLLFQLPKNSIDEDELKKISHTLRKVFFKDKEEAHSPSGKPEKIKKKETDEERLKRVEPAPQEKDTKKEEKDKAKDVSIDDIANLFLN